MSSGENILLPECEQRFHAVVGWSDPEGGHAVDLSALLLTKNRTVRSDRDMVFYNQPASVDGAVRHEKAARSVGLAGCCGSSRTHPTS